MHDVSELKQLINFHKDEFHSFQSSIEPFDETEDGPYSENNKFVNEMIHETLTNYGIQVDTSSSKETINKIDFNVFHIIIDSPEDEIILYQDVYSCLRNGYDLGINLHYINDKEKSELQRVWKGSRFE